METTTPSKPAVETTRVLRPHAFGLNKTCCVCAQAQAHWSIQHARYGTALEDICALCFLYESGWLVRQREQRVEQVIKAIALKRGAVLPQKGEQKRLVLVTDADSVLGAIVLHDRFELVTRRAS